MNKTNLHPLQLAGRAPPLSSKDLAADTGASDDGAAPPAIHRPPPSPSPSPSPPATPSITASRARNSDGNIGGDGANGAHGEDQDFEALVANLRGDQEVHGSGGNNGNNNSGNSNSSNTPGDDDDDDDDDEPEFPCPVCFENEEDADINGSPSRLCCACGNQVCGSCEVELAKNDEPCPMCRVELNCGAIEDVARLEKLLDGDNRPAGRHTPVAQYVLGDYHMFGVGVVEDRAKGLAWMMRAADPSAGNYAKAQCAVGLAYCKGWGCDLDYSEGVRWYREAANQGLATAEVYLGNSYLHGWGTAQDVAVAVEWFEKAAAHGDSQGDLSHTHTHTLSPTHQVSLTTLLTLLSLSRPSPLCHSLTHSPFHSLTPLKA